MSNHHFFAASATTWASTNENRDLQALIKMMDKERLSYNLYLVPCPHTEFYEIKWYQPQVEGTIHLDTFTFKRKKT